MTIEDFKENLEPYISEPTLSVALQREIGCFCLAVGQQRLVNQSAWLLYETPGENVFTSWPPTQHCVGFYARGRQRPHRLRRIFKVDSAPVSAFKKPLTGQLLSRGIVGSLGGIIKVQNPTDTLHRHIFTGARFLR